MRPDPDSDQAGAESEYGDDTGFAAQATRTGTPEVEPAEDSPIGSASAGEGGADETAGLTTEDDDAADPGTGAD
jgi:hypothetical protein